MLERGKNLKIDAQKLHELYLCNVKPIAKDERFYAIPHAEKYALSTYGRAFKKSSDRKYEKLKVVYKDGEEAYSILYDNCTEEKNVIISKLLSSVFFPNLHIFRLYNPKSYPHKRRWRIENLHIIESKEQMIETLLAKMNHRGLPCSNELTNHIFIGRWNPPQSQNIQKALNKLYASLKTRATNPKQKVWHPQYSATTISKEWAKSPELFKQYWLDKQYYYPEKLSVDKDILGLGSTNHYAEGLVIPIPVYINDIFTRNTSKLGYCIIKKKRTDGSVYYKIPQNAYMFDGKYEQNIYCDTYAEALQAGRIRKANYIRKVVNKERKDGFIPEYILETMEKWATLCEAGKISIWEPSDETKKEMKIL